MIDKKTIVTCALHKHKHNVMQLSKLFMDKHGFFFHFEVQ